VTQEVIRKKLKELEAAFIRISKNKSNRSPEILHKAQNFIIVALCGGVCFPSRRALDWTEMRFQGLQHDDGSYNAYEFPKK